MAPHVYRATPLSISETSASRGTNAGSTGPPQSEAHASTPTFAPPKCKVPLKSEYTIPCPDSVTFFAIKSDPTTGDAPPYFNMSSLSLPEDVGRFRPQLEREDFPRKPIGHCPMTPVEVKSSDIVSAAIFDEGEM